MSLPWSASGAAPEPLMGPWLQRPTSDSVVVMWETSEPTRGVVRYGSASDARREARSDGEARLHEVRLDGLTPGAACVYEVEAVAADGRRLRSAPATFVPAPLPGAPVCFAVVGDTQDQPAVWRRVAARVHAERPAFLLHCGDIVGDGHDPRAWSEEFFAPARALLAHVPFLAVLGNHEGDSPLYYRYVQTGGAGGYPETHAPARSWFTAHVRACHHFVLVNVLGATLDLKAYDDEGRLFDHWVRLQAPPPPLPSQPRPMHPYVPGTAIRTRTPVLTGGRVQPACRPTAEFRACVGCLGPVRADGPGGSSCERRNPIAIKGPAQAGCAVGSRPPCATSSSSL